MSALEARLLLVGVKSAATTTVAATISTAGEPSTTAVAASTAATKTSTSAATAHAREVGPLGSNFDAAALEHALIKNKSLGDDAGLRELNVSISEQKRSVSNKADPGK
jgi:hypothetical protein